jgi:hypothetical protein
MRSVVTRRKEVQGGVWDGRGASERRYDAERCNEGKGRCDEGKGWPGGPVDRCWGRVPRALPWAGRTEGLRPGDLEYGFGPELDTGM